MVKVAIGWRGELESAEANVIKRFIVNAESLVRILYKLVNRERSIVRLLTN